MKGHTYSKRRPFNQLFATAPVNACPDGWDRRRQALANATSELIALSGAYMSATGATKMPERFDTVATRRAAHAHMRYPAGRESYTPLRRARLGGN
jgi:hypothetical protein